MANFNKVMLIGNLTRDPQLSYTPNQTAVVDFGLAVNRRWTGQDGQSRDETCFVDCRMFGKRAEVVNKYCKKGNPLFVEELTHSLVENGSIQRKDDRFVLACKPSEIEVPDTIQGIIAARMDRRARPR